MKEKAADNKPGAKHAGQLDSRLLDILICPLTRTKLRQEGDVLVSEKEGIRYPIREGIPILLLEEAEIPDDAGGIEQLRKRYDVDLCSPGS